MSDIKFGTKNVGSAVPIKKYSVGGNINRAKGGGTVEAVWGEISGDIENQTDLMNALSAKADASDLANYATTADLATKMDAVSGSNGQFLSLVDGVWTAVNLPVYEGSVN